MRNIWFNQGYSVVRDALLLIREGAAAAGVDDLRLLASHGDVHAAVLEAADYAFLEPRRSETGPADYAAWCANMCEQLGVDLFMVQGRQQAIAQHRHLFPARTRIVLPTDAQGLATITDKAAFYRVAQAAKLPMPLSREVASVAEFDAGLSELARLDLPACMKPREGVFGHGFWVFDPRATLFDTLMAGDDRRTSPRIVREAIATCADPVRLLLMEYLPGPEWSLDCLCDAGRLVVGVARRKRGRVQEIEVDGPIFGLARRAVDLFGLTGLINVQFKAADREGEDPRLLEINPRMSGGIARTRFAGVNLPWRNLAMLLGLDDSGEVAVPVGGALVAAHETGIPLRPFAHDRVHV